MARSTRKTHPQLCQQPYVFNQKNPHGTSNPALPAVSPMLLPALTRQ